MTKQFITIKHVINLLSDIPECEANPCENGGTCQNTIGSFTCTCVAGYDGSSCQNGKSIFLFSSITFYYRPIVSYIYNKLGLALDKYNSTRRKSLGSFDKNKGRLELRLWNKQSHPVS